MIFPTVSRTLVLGGVVLVSACSTEFYADSVSFDAPAGTQINGIPFRLSQPHLVKLFKKTQHGYVPIHERIEYLPSEKQIHVLRLDSGLLSDAGIDVQLRADGTLSVVETKSVKSKGDEALADLGSAISSIDKAIASRKTALDAAEASKDQEFKSSLDDQATALQLKLDAELLQAEFDAISEATTGSVLRQKRKALLVAKFAANIAYQKLGQPAPFPEVSFP